MEHAIYGWPLVVSPDYHHPIAASHVTHVEIWNLSPFAADLLMTTVPPEIIGNFHYFLTEILPIASYNEKWDCEDLHRARKWAMYCKKVFSNLKLCNSPHIAESVYDAMQPLVADMPAFELRTVLENPVSALNETLMQNPFLSDKVFAELVKVNLQSENDTDQFIKDTQRLASSRATAVHLINSLKEYNCESLKEEIEALYG